MSKRSNAPLPGEHFPAGDRGLRLGIARSDEWRPPRWTPRLLIIVVIFLAAGWSATSIRLETELLALLPQELPSVRGLDGFSRQFASDREVTLVALQSMSEAERDGAFRTLRPLLSALPDVESVAVPHEEWVTQAPLFAAWIVWNSPPAHFQNLTAALEPAAVREKLRALPDVLAGALDADELALHQFDPLGLVKSLDPHSPGGVSAPGPPISETPGFSLAITSRQPLIEFRDCVDFCAAIQRTIQTALPGETRLLLTGRPAFTAEISQQMRLDMKLMIGVAVSLVSVAFWLFYRSLKPLPWILLGQFLALGVALVGARLGVGSLNVISMGFACILLGISMDYSILVYHHFVSRFRDDRSVWRRLRRGIWFSAATTAAAFLVLAFASIPGLRQLAFLVAAGLIASAGFATWLLPAAWVTKPPRSLPFLHKASDHVASAVQKWGNTGFFAIMGIALLIGLRAAQNPTSLYAPDLDRLQPATSTAFRGQLELVQHDTAASDAIFLVHAPTWDAVKSATDTLCSRFPGQPISPTTALIPSPSRQRENAALWPKDIVASLRSMFAEAGLGEEWSRSTLEFCTALTAAANGQSDAFTPIRAVLSKLAREEADGCRAVVRIPNAGHHPIPPGGINVSGATVLPVSWVALKEELNHAAQHDLARLALGVTAAILVLCYLAQRSFRLMLLNLAAIVMAMLLFSALLVLTGTRLSPLSLLCVPLLLGLVVDYSLHVLMALEQEQGDLRNLYAHIGAPILLTGLASCIGFGAPMLTRQPALQNFGLVMDLGIAAAIAACLFLLPVLARWTMRRPGT